MEEKENVGNWYDSFAADQVKTGVNLRHFKIMELLAEFGLQKDHKVLELGCGIGTLTGLLGKYVNKGSLLATDISPQSVEIAKKRLAGQKHVTFEVTDMSDFKHEGKFDFIVLPDVLEHIPIDQHRNLFRVLSEHMHDQSKILIHIPHPVALDFIRENYPERMQIIDQSINASTLLDDAYSNDLILSTYTSYSLFHKEHDYALITFKKNVPTTLTPLPKKTIILRKLKARLKVALK